MPTEKEVADIYQRALDALSETIAARTGVTEQQKDLAEQKQKQLSLEFVNTVMKSVEERTAKFQEFIGAMQALIDEFDPSNIVEGIKELKGLVDEAGQLILAAVPKAEAALPATAEKQKAAVQPKPMMALAEPKQPMAKAPASAAKPATGAKAKAKAKKPATPSTANASKAGKPAAKAPPAATPKAASKAKSAAAPKKAAKKKPSVSKPAAKKPAAKKPAAKKPTAKKPATKKPAPKRAAVQKKPARKAKKPG